MVWNGLKWTWMESQEWIVLYIGLIPLNECWSWFGWIVCVGRFCPSSASALASVTRWSLPPRLLHPPSLPPSAPTSAGRSSTHKLLFSLLPAHRAYPATTRMIRWTRRPGMDGDSLRRYFIRFRLEIGFVLYYSMSLFIPLFEYFWWLECVYKSHK
jgi:hypothetical protein